MATIPLDAPSRLLVAGNPLALYHVEVQFAIRHSPFRPDRRPQGDDRLFADASRPEPWRLENRGRAWLIFGFIFCPCHLPLTMAALGAVVSGGVLGAVVHDAWTIGILMAVLYSLTVWRGFAYLRRAKAALAPGKRLVCGAGTCQIEPSRPVTAQDSKRTAQD